MDDFYQTGRTKGLGHIRRIPHSSKHLFLPHYIPKILSFYKKALISIGTLVSRATRPDRHTEALNLFSWGVIHECHVFISTIKHKK